MPSRIWSLIWLSLALSACDQPRSPDTPTAVDPTEKAKAEQDVSGVLADARLALAEKRIAELQQKLDEMAITPQSMEIDLLKSRLAAVEAATFAKDAQPPASAASPAPVPRGTAEAGQKTTARTPLRLRELEPATRPAPQAEKAASGDGR